MRRTATPTWYPRAVACGRIVIGIIFLWAGLEKVVGSGGAWTAKGFLAFGTAGTLGWPFVTGTVAQGTVFNPTHDLWVSLAANDGAMTQRMPTPVKHQTALSREDPQPMLRPATRIRQPSACG